MELSQILLGENDEFLRGGEEITDVPVNATESTTPTSPLELDAIAIKHHVGESGFQSGLFIKMTLPELLAIVPRKRRRADAYTALVRHLQQNYNINLIIKKNRE